MQNGAFISIILSTYIQLCLCACVLVIKCKSFAIQFGRGECRSLGGMCSHAPGGYSLVHIMYK